MIQNIRTSRNKKISYKTIFFKPIQAIAHHSFHTQKFCLNPGGISTLYNVCTHQIVYYHQKRYRSSFLIYLRHLLTASGESSQSRTSLLKTCCPCSCCSIIMCYYYYLIHSSIHYPIFFFKLILIYNFFPFFSWCPCKIFCLHCQMFMTYI